MNKINVWLKRHSFLLITLIVWLILCVPQNVVTVIMYFHQDFKIPLIPNNFTCYEAYKSIQTEIKFWVNGILVTLLGCFGVIGNLFTALVLKRLATKSGFNRLLFCLGKKTFKPTIFWVPFLNTVKLGDKERFDKEQIGVKEPFPVTNCQFTS